jgi:two-component system alkaline phosphatase synthesis response regulator PhoP
MGNKKTILVIDDDPDILESIKAILTKNGFDVITAMSGHDGIEAAMNTKPDLILCDMMMEKIDAGSKVAEELRSKNLNVPIYLLSSIANATASNIEIDQLGFNGMFQKPVDPDQLVSLIRKTLAL